MIRLTRILRGIKARTIDKFRRLTPLIQPHAWNHFGGNIFLNLNGACLTAERACSRPARGLPYLKQAGSLVCEAFAGCEAVHIRISSQGLSHGVNQITVATVPSFDRANRNNNGNYWSGIPGILSIQLAVLFALSVAALVYLNWSSKAALTEFMATGKPSLSEPSHPPQPAPLQQVKNRTACPRRA
jgi:hypothetical protein